jgi:hypothetical protein
MFYSDYQDVTILLKNKFDFKFVNYHKIVLRTGSSFFKRVIDNSLLFEWEVEDISIAENILNYFYFENKKSLVGDIDIYISLCEQLELNTLIQYFKRKKHNTNIKFKKVYLTRSTRMCLRSNLKI